jgi:hypothetical protein
MKCGDVIFQEGKPHVITQIVDGLIVETERLEDYVMENTVIEHGGQKRTLFGLLHEYMADYLYHAEIVKGKKYPFDPTVD